jgi:hypothetical protein
MGDIADTSYYVVQYPKDIVTDVGEVQPQATEEALAETEAVNENESVARTNEEYLGQHIDVTV